MKTKMGKHWSRHNEQHASKGLLERIHQAATLEALDRLEIASSTTFPNASAKTRRRWQAAIDVVRKRLTNTVT